MSHEAAKLTESEHSKVCCYRVRGQRGGAADREQLRFHLAKRAQRPALESTQILVSDGTESEELTRCSSDKGIGLVSVVLYIPLMSHTVSEPSRSTVSRRAESAAKQAKIARR
jgi:hypothetical protein